MNEQAITDEIFDAAVLYAQSKKVSFGQGADNDIRNFASTAAAEINQITDGRQASRINAAKLSFYTLIDEMIRESNDIPGYRQQNVGIIGEQTLHNAKLKLCPLWPIC